MIRKEDNFLLGIITRTHGTKGSVVIKLRNLKAEEIKKRDWLFVETDGILVPFYITEFRSIASDSIIVSFEDVNSEPEARIFNGNDVYISTLGVKRTKKKLSDSIPVSGYEVIDVNLGIIGIAGSITGISSNLLLSVHQNEKEWFIPVHEDIILEINDSERKIIINAPDGLFNI